MTIGLLGLKVGMTQIYNAKGQLDPVTVLQVGPCPVLQVKSAQSKDKYNAIQIGFLDKERRKARRSEQGHVASRLESNRRKLGIPLAPKADCEPQRHIKECRLDKPAEQTIGTLLNDEAITNGTKSIVGKVLSATEVFKDVKRVDVVGTSKGRGFSGSMKRHGFHGLPAAHGAKKVHRSGGSIGSMASNRGSGRPKKGHKAAGQYGNVQRTIRNLDIVRIDSENHLVLVKGAVPGPNGGLIFIRPTNKVAGQKEPNPDAQAKKKKK